MPTIEIVTDEKKYRQWGYSNPLIVISGQHSSSMFSMESLSYKNLKWHIDKAIVFDLEYEETP
ncbi:hypothetical protein V7O66_02950 [Methanolobus sp. ZRKC3]|uniref:hypothetical protein n=1 Tax=Methanolobus sp. ZRKC3 TaxID=3125786 RepID=UPI00324AF70A